MISLMSLWLATWTAWSAEPEMAGWSAELHAALAPSPEALSLSDAMRLGEDTSAAWEATRWEVQAADTAVRASWVGVLPSATLSGFVAQVSVPEPVDPSLAAFSWPERQGGASAQLAVPLTQMLAVGLPSRRAAQRAASARGHDAEATRRVVRRDVADAYFAHASARGATVVATSQLAEAQEHLRVARLRQEAGMATSADVARLRALVAASEGGLTAALAQTTATAASLRMLTGVGEPGALALSDALPGEAAVSVPDVTTLLDGLSSRRPDVRAIEEAIAAAGHRRRAARASALPMLALAAAVEVGSPAPRSLPPDPDAALGWSVGAQVSWSPGGVATGVLGADRVGYEQAAMEARLRRAREVAELEVQRAHAQLTGAVGMARAARDGWDAAEEALALRRAAFEEGMASVEDLQAALHGTSNARVTWLDAQYGVRLAGVHLRLASGQEP